DDGLIARAGPGGAGPVEDLRPPGRQDRRHSRRGAVPSRPEAEDRLRRRRQGRLLRRGPGRGLRRHGTLRLGQVDAGAVPDPADRAHGRHRDPRRHRRHRRVGEPAPRRAPQPRLDGLPALRAAAAPPGDRQRRLRARDPGDGQEGAAGEGGRGLRSRRPQRLRDVVPRSALRRHAAARRSRPRAGRRAVDAAVRRAVLRSRPADPSRHAERGHPAPGRAAEDDGLHHPRPAGSPQARRPHPDHARRRDRPARDAGPGGGCTRRRLRPRLHLRGAEVARPDAEVGHARAA
ncbi:MAG: Glycine betaine ABC transport system, ATP-binding protein OpuAA, partial [uncultured Nocardioidaceae bacterium]